MSNKELLAISLVQDVCENADRSRMSEEEGEYVDELERLATDPDRMPYHAFALCGELNHSSSAEFREVIELILNATEDRLARGKVYYIYSAAKWAEERLGARN